ncbi:hypothetical protein GCM10009665_61670 [Kitasatospora nipponensis]|uniref:Uncharacterized protein n=1 Tax=Kitasatospora nipponensis TaxID=258049 RepID=A0ABN1WV55_9ACTN
MIFAGDAGPGAPLGLLEQRELTARRRTDELREEADRVQAEPAVVQREWNEWVVARSRVGEVLAPAEDVPALSPAGTCRIAVNSRCRPGPRWRRSRARPWGNGTAAPGSGRLCQGAMPR